MERSGALALRRQNKVVLVDSFSTRSLDALREMLLLVDVPTLLMCADLVGIELAPVLVVISIESTGGPAIAAAYVVVDVGRGVGAPPDFGFITRLFCLEPPRPVITDLHPAASSIQRQSAGGGTRWDSV